MKPINLARLVDAYVERHDQEWGATETTYPELIRYDVDGEPWLTDRFWMMPEKWTHVGGVKFNFMEMKTNPAAKLTEQLQGLLSDTDETFAPCFAGELTRAGLTARGVAGAGRMCALVDGEGTRVGAIMPVHEARPGSTLPIPVPAAVLALQGRIERAAVVTIAESWLLAARMTFAAGADA